MSLHKTHHWQRYTYLRHCVYHDPNYQYTYHHCNNTLFPVPADNPYTINHHNDYHWQSSKHLAHVADLGTTDLHTSHHLQTYRFLVHGVNLSYNRLHRHYLSYKLFFLYHLVYHGTSVHDKFLHPLLYKYLSLCFVQRDTKEGEVTI